MTRKRVRQTVIDQFSLRLYGESPRDVWIAAALRPLGTGMLRAVMIEALYEGLHVLQKKGWNLGEQVQVERAFDENLAATLEKDQPQSPDSIPKPTPEITADELEYRAKIKAAMNR
ncbi:MAG: hypothetical protein PHX24_03585 [Acidithiobacillus sp.]|nr:hypothetical protein [Acidithiobacillus sp.]